MMVTGSFAPLALFDSQAANGASIAIIETKAIVFLVVMDIIVHSFTMFNMNE
ncbi:hypothetical protein JS533_011460 [Bifidobacterium amazonense]|uniref:ABC transporter permease n=1 Tax=Bifidobacterium amazonense TaxID=2809027 RepID=A0ABS9VXP7_9BIFI|nr:hypothetical protein [Bifidobacterium amazonense]MCH9276880.1 hypothetical protein [Bifidobacterium amazonense]